MSEDIWRWWNSHLLKPLISQGWSSGLCCYEAQPSGRRCPGRYTAIFTWERSRASVKDPHIWRRGRWRWAWDNYFIPKVNTIHERACFHQHTQRLGETTEKYIRTPHVLADTCNFGCVKEENTLEWLVIGILNKKISDKLKKMPDLTLNKTVELVRQRGASACANLS